MIEKIKINLSNKNKIPTSQEIDEAMILGFNPADLIINYYSKSDSYPQNFPIDRLRIQHGLSHGANFDSWSFSDPMNLIFDSLNYLAFQHEGKISTEKIDKFMLMFYNTIVVRVYKIYESEYDSESKFNYYKKTIYLLTDFYDLIYRHNTANKLFNQGELLSRQDEYKKALLDLIKDLERNETIFYKFFKLRNNKDFDLRANKLVNNHSLLEIIQIQDNSNHPYAQIEYESMKVLISKIYSEE